MESLDYWRLCDELSVFHAILLVIDCDPSEYPYVEDWGIQERPKGYEAVKAALINASLQGQIDGKITPIYEYDINGNICGEIVNSLDIRRTIISVSSMKKFLRNRGFNKGFFFPNTETNQPDYLDSNNSRYSPKLAAAIESWLAVTQNSALTNAKSVKQAIVIYLRSHAGRFGLIKDDGNPNENGIEEVAKVANWETRGGAPKTPEQ